MQLYHAAAQWANRPQDERFTTLEAMHAATLAYAEAARVKEVPWTDLRVEATGETDLALVGKAGVPALLTNYAFGQMAARIKAPASYLRTLPATLAAQNLNHGLKARVDGTAQLLFHQNGGLVLRAATSDEYARIWDHEIVARLIDLSAKTGLVPARTTMGGAENPEGLDMNGVASRALYASDHDLFAFLMSPDRAVQGPLGEALYRGIIVRNSEVGNNSLSVLGFWFREVCYNHIIWGAENIADIRLTHRGDIARRWAETTVRVRRYMDGAASLDTARFKELSTKLLGPTKDDVLDMVFGVKSLQLTRATLEAGYEAVQEDIDGDARTAWGLANGLTRVSQIVGHADDRTALDRAAGKLLSIEF